METASERRYLVTCLVASVLGFVIWLLAFPESHLTWIFGLAILALAALRFVDGYLVVRYTG